MAQFTPTVIAAAQKAQRDWLVPASVTLAQFAIESAYGTRMPTGSNNPFGIKAVGSQPFVTANTREVINGKSIVIPQNFRKFADFAEAFDAHAKLLATVGLYAPALAAWKAGDLTGGINLMAKHYATAPDYATVLLSIIKSQNLSQYDHPAVAPASAPSSAQPPLVPVSTPSPQPSILETAKMNLSILSLILRFLPLLPMLEADIALEVKTLNSSADGASKLNETIVLLEDMLAKIKAAIAG